MNSNKEYDKKNFYEYLVCLDPLSGLIYSQNLATPDVHIEEDVPEIVYQRARECIESHEYLRDPLGKNWIFESDEAHRYRRRKVPPYLLHRDAGKYPTILVESSLSGAFEKTTSILLEVDMSNYKEVMDQVNQSGRPTPKKIMLTVELVTGADEVIKNILRTLYKDYQIKIRPHNENNQFSIKVFGFREYLIGNHSMLTYDRVRASLRGFKVLPIILTEIPKITDKDKLFPPIILRRKDDVQAGRYTPVDWDRYQDVPFLLWYPPIDIRGKKEADLRRAKKFTLKDILSKPRACVTRFMDDFKEDRRFVAENTVVEFDRKELFSGECDAAFRIRLCGADNLQKLFIQVERGACDNGIETPDFITKEDADVWKKKRAADKTKRVEYPKLYNKADFAPGQVPDDTSHANHGYQSTVWQQFMKKQNLPFVPYMIICNVMLLQGNIYLTKTPMFCSKPTPISNNPRFYEWIRFEDVPISHIPLGSRLAFEIKMLSNTGDDMIIASGYMNVFDDEGKFKSGMHSLYLWPFYKVDPRLVCMGQFMGTNMANYPSDLFNNPEALSKYMKEEYPRLQIQLESFCLPMYYSGRDSVVMKTLNPFDVDVLQEKTSALLKRSPATFEVSKLQKVLKRDPLSFSYTDEEREVLIVCRHHYKSMKGALTIFLGVIDWTDPELVTEAHKMLREWTPLDPEQAIALLDARFGDEAVRMYAVERISEMTDDTLCLYMLELVAALMYEPQHLSPLSEMLLERALKSPIMVGHDLFWQLRASLHVKPSIEKYSLLLEQFIMLCGGYREQLQEEVKLNNELKTLGESIISFTGDKDGKKAKLRSSLPELKKKFPGKFTFALDCRFEANDFIPEESRIMNSKKEPTWITCRNAQPGAENIDIMFKVGDDLRQDILTIQLLKIMDKLWLDEGLDFRMKPYKVLATLDQVGMIEIVRNSETIASIHKKYGGSVGAFSETTIISFLKAHNPDEESYQNAVENFIRSCAGYCVATFVLGIGDRHSDNIMVTKFGHLFHIDFGHILGNFKEKGGFKRERTKFVFTKEMAAVFGGDNPKNEQYKRFEELCASAYNVVRKHGFFLIDIFMIMISVGMPELKQVKDISYLRDQLCFGKSDHEAKLSIKQEIKKCLDDVYRQFDNLIHETVRK